MGKTALLETYRRVSGNAADLAQFESRIKAGEAAARQTLQEWAFWLARCLLTLINLLNPGHVVVGGPLSALWPYVREEVEANLEGERIPGNEHVTLTQSKFGEDRLRHWRGCHGLRRLV